MKLMDQVEYLTKSVENLERAAEKNNTLPAQVLQAVNSTLEQKIGGLVTVLNGVIRILGKEAVEQAVKDQQAEDDQKQVERAKAQIEAGLAAGVIKKVEAVTPESLVVGVEYNKEGVPFPPGRTQMKFDQMQPIFQQDVLGKTPNTELEIKNPNGEVVGKFLLTEIYEETGAAAAPTAP